MSDVMTLLWKMSWQSASITCLFWIISKVMHRAPASWRYALWFVVLCKFFMPPVGNIPSEMAFWHRSNAVVPMRTILAAREHTASHATTAHTPGQSVATMQRVQGNTGGAADLNFKETLTAMWMFGICLMSVRLIRRLARQRAIIRTSSQVDSTLSEILDDCARRVSVRRLPHMMVSDRATTPMLVGLIRPVILLPPGISERCSPTDLSAILMHELAHIRRRDMLGIWLHQLAQVLFFFNPAVWLVGREMSREREFACDEKVLAISGIARDEYVSGYISALKLANGVAASAMAIAMAEPFELERYRIENIVHGKTPRVTVKLGIALAIIAAMSLPTYAGIKLLSHESAVAFSHSLPDTELNSMLLFEKPLVYKDGETAISLLGLRHSVEPSGNGFLTLYLVYSGQPKGYRLGELGVFDQSGRALALRKTDWGIFNNSPHTTQAKASFQGAGPAGGKVLREVWGELLPSIVPDPSDGISIEALRKPSLSPGDKLPIQLIDWSISNVPSRRRDLDNASSWRPEEPGKGRGYLSMRLYMMLSDKDIVTQPLDIEVFGSDGRWRTLFSNQIHFIIDDQNWMLDRQPYLGIQIAGDPDLAPSNKVKPVIGFVMDGGPACKAGLQAGDLIVRLGDKSIGNMLDLESVLYDLAKTQSASITVLRRGKEVVSRIEPVLDPIWTGMRLQPKAAREGLEKLAGGHTERRLAMCLLYDDSETLPVNYRPLKIAVKHNPATLKPIHFTFRNVPIPEEFWTQKERR